jgi:hypothetical protein
MTNPLDEEPGQEVGADVPAVSWRWQEVTLALVALVVLLSVIVALRSHLDVFVRPQHTAAMDTTRAMRERRGTLLPDLARQGLVTEVDSAGESPRIFVAPAFHALAPDARLSVMHSVYAAFYPAGDAGGVMLLVYDAKSRRLIGSYTPSHGLTLEE